MAMRASTTLLRNTLRRATPSTTVAAPIFQHHRTIHHHPHPHSLPNNNKKTTFGLALCSATLLGSCASNFASCAGPDDPSKARLVKEMNASMDRIDRYLDAERAVEDLEQQVKDKQSRAPNTEINRTDIPVALCQIHVGANKATNLINARKAVQDAARKGARIISLPECFQCPYDTSCFPTYAEPIPDSADQIDVEKSPSTAMLLEVAKECNIYLVGGSIPERGADGNVYNTCVIVSPDGKILGKHRKMHLFDIDVPGNFSGHQHCSTASRT